MIKINQKCMCKNTRDLFWKKSLFHKVEMDKDHKMKNKSMKKKY